MIRSLGRLASTAGAAALISSCLGGSARTTPPGDSIRSVSLAMNAIVTTRRASTSPAAKIVFENIVSTVTDGPRELRLRVRCGVMRPLRQGPFLLLNHPELKLEGVVVEAILPAPFESDPQVSPFVTLIDALVDGVRAVVGQGSLRQYTIETIDDALKEQRIGRFTYEPVTARVINAGRSVDVFAVRAVWSGDAAGLRMTDVKLTTAGHQVLQTQEAYFTRSGNLVIPGRFTLSSTAGRTRGHSAVFSLSATGSSLVRRRVLTGTPSPGGSVFEGADVTFGEIVNAIFLPALFPIARGGRRASPDR